MAFGPVEVLQHSDAFLADRLAQMQGKASRPRPKPPQTPVPARTSSPLAVGPIEALRPVESAKPRDLMGR